MKNIFKIGIGIIIGVVFGLVLAKIIECYFINIDDYRVYYILLPLIFGVFYGWLHYFREKRREEALISNSEAKKWYVNVVDKK